MTIGPRVHGGLCWLTSVTTLGLGAAAAAPAAAWAIRSTGKANVTTVDQGPEDTGTFGSAPWRSGSLAVVASRVADGRIHVRAHAHVVARRAFRAQLAITPCNAVVNSVHLADPLAYPNPPVVVTLNGPDAVTRKQFRRGVNDVRLEAIVSTDAWYLPEPHHWTDCASADLLDEDENDAAALAATPEAQLRELRTAFRSPTVFLSWTSEDGEHH
jgi:hypothetical protein